MTVIAWDGETLAADKRCTLGGMATTVSKIHHINGSLLGFAGDAPMVGELLEWFRAHELRELFPLRQLLPDDWAGAIIIRPDRRISRLERGPVPYQIEMPFFAIGSGSDLAIAAMHCGKSAREAVEIASIYNVNCGNGIDTLALEI